MTAPQGLRAVRTQNAGLKNKHGLENFHLAILNTLKMMTNPTYKQVDLCVLTLPFMHTEQSSFTTLDVKVEFHC